MPEFKNQESSLMDDRRRAKGMAIEIAGILKNVTTKAEVDDAITNLSAQWKNDFLSAGFDIDNNTALPNFDGRKVAMLESKLDALLVDIGMFVNQAVEKDRVLLAKIQLLDEEIDSSLSNIPILRLELNTKEKTSLTMRNFKSFNPLSEAGERIDIRDLGIAGVIAHRPKLNMKTSSLLDNPETEENEGIKRIANYLENIYFNEHPDILQAFGISDLKHITPRQAVQLASYIPIERIEYTKGKGISRASVDSDEAAINDAVPIDKLFKWDKDKSGNGVCRNYASVAIGVLEALKILQTENTSLIHNTYATNIEHVGELKDIPGAVFQHAWNGFFTVSHNQSNKELTIDGVVLDSTWADSSSLSSDPSRVGNNEVKLDYTEERFFTLIQKFEKIGLLAPEQYMKQLLDNYKNSSPLTGEGMVEQKTEQELLSPARLSIAYRILSILDDMPKIPVALIQAAEEFFRLFTVDIEEYGRSFDPLSAKLSSWTLKKEIIYPLTNKLPQVIGLYQKLGGEKNSNLAPPYQKIIQFINEIPTQSWNSNYIFDLNDNYITLADKIGNFEMVRSQGEMLKVALKSNNAPEDRKNSPNEIYDKLSPEGKKVFEGIFSNIGKKEEETKEDEYSIQRRIGQRFNCYVSNYVYGDNGKKILIGFLQKLETVLESLSADEIWQEHTPLRINEDPKDEVSLEKVILNMSMTENQIRKKISEFKSNKKKWNEVQQSCPCEIKFWHEPSSPKEMNIFIKNAKEYFLTAPYHLLYLKEMSIGFSDDVSDYTHPRISYKHFINGDFAKLNELLSTHDQKKYERIHAQFDVKKQFQDLNDQFHFLTKSNTDVSDTSLGIASDYFEPIKATLNRINTEQQYTELRRIGFGFSIEELSGELYDKNEKTLLQEGYPYYLIKALNYTNTENVKKLIDKDGTVLNSKRSLGEILTRDIEKLSHITVYISQTKSGNRQIDKARSELAKSNPITITKVEGKNFYSNGEKLYLLAGDKINAEADPKSKLGLDGHITLYTTNTPERIGKEMLKQAERYIEFKRNVAEVQNILPQSVKLIPRYNFGDLDEESEECLKRLQEIFKGQDLSFMKTFLQVSIGIYKDLIEIKIKSQDENNHEYEILLEFGSDSDSEFLSKIKMYFKAIKKIDAKVIHIQESYGVKLSIYSVRMLTPNKIDNYLSRGEKVLNTGDYYGYSVSISPDTYTSDDYKDAGNNVFVNKNNKEIMIK